MIGVGFVVVLLEWWRELAQVRSQGDCVGVVVVHCCCFTLLLLLLLEEESERELG